MSTRTSVCLYNQPVTWIFTRSRLSSLSDSDYKSNPFIEKYYLVIVVFSCPHFSIYDIFHTLENTRSFNERATHFNRRVHTTDFRTGQTGQGTVSQRIVRVRLCARFTTGVNLRLLAFQKAYHSTLIVVVCAHKQTWTFLFKFMS